MIPGFVQAIKLEFTQRGKRRGKEARERLKERGGGKL